MAYAVKPAAVSRGRLKRCYSRAGAAPLQQKAFAVFIEGDAQRLEQGGDRAMQAVAQGQSNRELRAMSDIDFANQRDIAVADAVKFAGQLEIARQILPSVGCPDIAAGTAQKSAADVQRKPGAVFVRGQNLASSTLRRVAVIAPSANVEVWRQQKRIPAGRRQDFGRGFQCARRSGCIPDGGRRLSPLINPQLSLSDRCLGNPVRPGRWVSI